MVTLCTTQNLLCISVKINLAWFLRKWHDLWKSKVRLSTLTLEKRVMQIVRDSLRRGPRQPPSFVLWRVACRKKKKKVCKYSNTPTATAMFAQLITKDNRIAVTCDLAHCLAAAQANRTYLWTAIKAHLGTIVRSSSSRIMFGEVILLVPGSTKTCHLWK